MVNREPSSSQKQFLTTRTIQIEILRQPTACLFDIRTRLVKREPQTIPWKKNLNWLCLALFRCLIKRCAWRNYFGTTQEKHHTFIQPHFFNLDTLSDCSQSLQPRGKQHISSPVHRQKVNDHLQIINVVQNEQPSGMRGQPALYGPCYDFLIWLRLFREIEHSREL